MTIVTRFAPSPTGSLHVGHAYSALFAAQQGERFLLRIENIDPIRCKDDFIAAIYDDLAWLGLTWPLPVRVQSQCMADYQTALQKLKDMQLVYPCFCTRKDIELEITQAGHAPHHGPDGMVYPGTCRQLHEAARKDKIDAGQAHCWRLDMEKAVGMTGDGRWHDRAKGWQQTRPQDFGDVVLARKDIPASYHLAVTVDDALQGVTLVTRSTDLFRATDIHRLLQMLLGLPCPDYHHHPVLTNEAGQRLSKRDQAQSLRDLRVSGLSAAALRSRIGMS